MKTVSTNRGCWIDGQLIRRRLRRDVRHINPATEEVLARSPMRQGRMHRAIDAARRAFGRDRLVDEPRVPQGVPSSSCRRRSRPSGAFREELILEVGCPRITRTVRSSTLPSLTRISYPRSSSTSSVGDALPDRSRPDRPVNSGDLEGARGVVGAIVPWNFRSRSRSNRSGRRSPPATDGAQAGADTPYNATRLGRLIGGGLGSSPDIAARTT